MRGYASSVLSVCKRPGCSTFVLGDGVCLAHETQLPRKFVRGRPYRYPIALDRHTLAQLVADAAASRAPIPLVSR